MHLFPSAAVLQAAEESLQERADEVRVARVESALRALRQTESLAALLPAALSARSLRCCYTNEDTGADDSRATPATTTAAHRNNSVTSDSPTRTGAAASRVCEGSVSSQSLNGESAVNGVSVAQRGEEKERRSCAVCKSVSSVGGILLDSRFTGLKKFL